MSDDTNLSFRMDRDLSLQLDRHVERMQAANPGIRVTKGDAVRSLLIAEHFHQCFELCNTFCVCHCVTLLSHWTCQCRPDPCFLVLTRTFT